MKLTSLFDYLTATKVRILGWSFFVAFFITIAMPLLFFFYLFNPNSVRKIIVNQFNSQAYTVKVGGDIEPKTWHGLTLFVADTSVYDKSGREVMHINAANYQLSWPSLIIGQYKIKRISLNGITIIKRNNNDNYLNLINYKTFRDSEFKDLKYLSANNFSITDADNNYLVKDAKLRISYLQDLPNVDLQLNIPKLNSTLSLSGDVIKSESQLLIDDLAINLNGNEYYTISAKSSSAYSFATQELAINDLTGLVDLPNYTGSFTVNSGSVSLYGAKINKLTTALHVKNSVYNQVMNITLTNLSTPDFINYLSSIANLNLNFTYDNHEISTVLNSTNLHFNDEFEVNNQKLEIIYNASCAESGLFPNSAIIAGFFSSNRKQKLISGNFKGVFKNSPFSISGKIDYAGIVPDINLIGNIESLKLEDVKGDKGNDSMLPMYQDLRPLQLDWLGKFNLTADLSAHNISLYQMNLNNASVILKTNANEINLSNGQANAYGGNISGGFDLVRESGEYGLNLNGKIKGVNLQDVFEDAFNISAITGLANIQLKTNSLKIVNFSDIYKKLSGSILLGVVNGGFSGVDFNLFLSPDNLAALTNTKAAKTKFTNLNSVFNFKNGVSESGTIDFNSATISAQGNGLIDFANDKIDYNLLIHSMLPNNSQQVKSVEIPTNVAGDLFKPKNYIKNMKLNKNQTK